MRGISKIPDSTRNFTEETNVARPGLACSALLASPIENQNNVKRQSEQNKSTTAVNNNFASGISNSELGSRCGKTQRGVWRSSERHGTMVRDQRESPASRPRQRYIKTHKGLADIHHLALLRRYSDQTSLASGGFAFLWALVEYRLCEV